MRRIVALPWALPLRTGGRPGQASQICPRPGRAWYGSPPIASSIFSLATPAASASLSSVGLEGAHSAAAPPAQGPSVGEPGERRAITKATKPFSHFLTDNFRRQHNYLRISITEKCNLRCLYCMPEEGVPLSPPAHLLTSPEIIALSALFVSQGVTKIRLTGGEPTVRRDFLPLMHSIGALRSNGLRELCLTTNGLSLHRKLDDLIASGLTGINLSLDTLDPFQFEIMTRRKGFDLVMKSIDAILDRNRHGAGVRLKINCVVMRGVNDREILPFVEMTRDSDVEVRFIEYMPFDGNRWNRGKMFSYQEMLQVIQARYPSLQKIDDQANDTSKTHQVSGFAGRVGFITSMTHNFCGTCNRLRITADGSLKVCLFGNAEVSLRDILRKGNAGLPIDQDGFEAMKSRERRRLQDLSTDETTSNLADVEDELLEVIGAAVKKKREKHAGIGQLENMKNRPMILIGENMRHRSRRSPFFNGLPPSGPNPWFISVATSSTRRASSTFARSRSRATPDSSSRLTHVKDDGSAHMVDVGEKQATHRVAIARGRIEFSNDQARRLIPTSLMKKGDVLATARIAGIMAAKRTADLIPLCHPLNLTAVEVDLLLNQEMHRQSASGQDVPEDFGGVDVTARVECSGPTGVEMEALTAVTAACLTVVDMCKGVDRGIRIEGVRVILKRGGRSGEWKEEGFDEATWLGH